MGISSFGWTLTLVPGIQVPIPVQGTCRSTVSRFRTARRGSALDVLSLAAVLAFGTGCTCISKSSETVSIIHSTTSRDSPDSAFSLGSPRTALSHLPSLLYGTANIPSSLRTLQIPTALDIVLNTHQRISLLTARSIIKVRSLGLFLLLSQRLPGGGC